MISKATVTKVKTDKLDFIKLQNFSPDSVWQKNNNTKKEHFPAPKKSIKKLKRHGMGENNYKSYT